MEFEFLHTPLQPDLGRNHDLNPVDLPDKLKSEWISWLSKNNCPDYLLKTLQTHQGKFVLCGQQIGLLLSPALTLYKIISAEIVAERLSLETGVPHLSVMWLQTEDHDVKEISSTTLIDNSLNFKTINFSFSEENRKSISDLSLNNSISSPDFSNLKIPENYLSLINNSLKTSTYTESFCYLFYNLLKNTRTLLFDPRALNLSYHTKEIYKSLILDPHTPNTILEKQIQNLIKSNLNPPIPISKGRSLIFFSDESGKRFRLKYSNEKHYINEKALENDELIDILDAQPSRFSSSALLRPILQDYIFSPSVFIGGETELLYHRQITPLYDYFKIKQPKLITRSKGVLIDSKFTKWVSTQNLDIQDYFTNKETFNDILKKILFPETSSIDDLKSKLDLKVEGIRGLLEHKVNELDETLNSPLAKTLDSINSSINKFLHKYEKGLILKNGVASNRLDRILSLTHPFNQPQERVVSIFSIFNLLGEDSYNIIKNSIAKDR